VAVLQNPECIAQLLGLLRAGEQSAEFAFGRVRKRLPPAAAQNLHQTLESIQSDEARHGRMLAIAAHLSGITPSGPAAAARRFLARLESRDPGVHLARIASLDGCVCQVLSRVLAADIASRLPHSVSIVLGSIRRDEGRHVRTARRLARELGMDTGDLRCHDDETRESFDSVLGCYEHAFLALDVDAGAMRRLIRREDF
jgi:hypothetical protein